MGKRKTKTILRDLGTLRHDHAYSKPCGTLAYLEPWYIQNPDILRTRSIFSTLVYHNPGIFRTPEY